LDTIQKILNKKCIQKFKKKLPFFTLRKCSKLLNGNAKCQNLLFAQFLHYFAPSFIIR
jgi:hypothetical protein